MEQLNIPASVNELQAFINQVSGFLSSGKLTPEEGQPLIDDAQLVIDYINANGIPAPVAPEPVVP